MTSEEIRKLGISEMTGLSFDCACGHRHTVDIRRIEIGRNIVGKMVDFAGPYKGGKIFMLADVHTDAVLGAELRLKLEGAGITVKAYVYPDERLVPDEKAVGRALVELEPDTSLIVAVGSGTINDIARMVACKTHTPYLIAATAPSVDGYASTVSPLIIEGFKTTYPAVYPAAIFADTEVLRRAPMVMIRAGFGDILGKYTALADWALSREKNGEYYCETAVELVRDALKKCVENRDKIQSRDEQVIRYIMEALVLSGLAMGMVGNSRPASGAEHHLAHYWEMDALKKGEEHPLHGNAVGAATVVSAAIYEMLAPGLPAGYNPPKPAEITAILRAAGAADSPKALGISRELFHRSVLHAKEIRPRYTILRYASQLGRLEEIADTLTRRFYD